MIDFKISKFQSFYKTKVQNIKKKLLSPTIIHHFGMNAPENFQYPLFSAGFILSKSVVEIIRKVDINDRWSGFAIDAKYEVLPFPDNIISQTISHFSLLSFYTNGKI